MQVVNQIPHLQQAISAARRYGDKIALVPTMGNLHDGHLQLVKQARTEADYLVVSIFVNPTQFAPNEDLDAYPRTEEEDLNKLNKCQVDLVFLPGVKEIYPENSHAQIQVKQLDSLLCGSSRPGHFTGVATIVGKLFNMVQPDCAFFGEKDYQQLMIIRQMVRDLNFPLSIHAVPTVREADGLALSSRNGYLTTQERKLAPMLYQRLCGARDLVLKGASEFRSIEEQAVSQLNASGFEVDYFSICRQQDLRLATDTDAKLVILTAAKLGRTRLIDNFSV